ncbi:hypothetical protein ACTMM4_21035 [Escherichia coli]|uniref:hypothetical protein n=1 Tax=Escherichia coli TaxID=562 RepID=UPI002DBEAF87
MFDVVVFGAGRFGSVCHVERHELTIKVPDCQVKAREMVGGVAVVLAQRLQTPTLLPLEVPEVLARMQKLSLLLVLAA